jgi:cell division protease FtsH
MPENDDGQRSHGATESGAPEIWRMIVWAVLVTLLLGYFVQPSSEQPRIELPYSEFKGHLQAGEVERVTLRGQQITGRLTVPVQAGEVTSESHLFTTTRPPVDDPALIQLLDEQEVTVAARESEPPWLLQALVNILPWMLLIGLLFYFSWRMQKQLAGSRGMFDFGKSKARRYHKGQSQVGFDDVAGLENPKRDLADVVGYLKQPERVRSLGAKPPRGVLMTGPPGTGKTLLARAVAGEAGVPFYSLSAAEFIEMFVGVGAARVRDMFSAAKKEAPAIIFIDEIDAVGRARGTGLGGGHDEREQTLNQILNEMDGFSGHEAVVVLAATNRPDVLDPALTRPGRFDRKVTLDRPHREARRAILAVHTREVPLADDVDLDTLAARTVGFSGADLENLVNEAGLLAAREERDRIDADLLEQARDKVVLGAERETLLPPHEKERVAYHEAGHALLTCLLEHTDPIAKVTIIPHGRALGVTEQAPEEERYNLPESYLRDRVTAMFGGRVSERLIYGEVSSGAKDDLQQATRLARSMVAQWGMNEELGPVAYRQGEEHVFLGREMAQQRDFSEHTAELVDEEVRKLVRSLERRAEELLTEHRDQLEELARALLEREVIEAEEIRAIAFADADCGTGGGAGADDRQAGAGPGRTLSREGHSRGGS